MKNKLGIKNLNHVALQITDIERSRAFYSQILGLQEIKPPAFDYPVLWFDLGEGRELHLIGREAESAWTPIRSNHFALEVIEMTIVEQYLKEKNIKHLPIKLRPDGAIQLFLNDPDGHFIELFQLV
ncbi:VOC family protein [Emticicia sp. SJ17W-69]|uniref:VOC family protein n=1 Tax=Emticicia sp. SJ17W-69 TaxID=3421657 RepID=UPI003EBF2788